MIIQVKKSLRMTGDVLNDDIQKNISAALLDMRRVGINTDKVNPSDPNSYDALTLSCVEFYCKWIYNFLQRGPEWQAAYIRLRDSMALCGDYRCKNK